MKFGRQFVLLALALLLLPGATCNKKKPHLPAQATAPAEPIPSPLPSEISEQAPPPPAPAPTADTEAKAQEPAQPKPKRRKPRKTSTTAQNNPPSAAAPTASTSSPNATIALARPPANPASEPPPDTAISADVSSAQLSQQKQTTAQLLDSTEKTLGGLHNLPPEQEQMIAQIRAYMAQSRKATTEGDFERAYNLATKAHLLSDALVKK